MKRKQISISILCLLAVLFLCGCGAKDDRPHAAGVPIESQISIDEKISGRLPVDAITMPEISFGEAPVPVDNQGIIYVPQLLDSGSFDGVLRVAEGELLWVEDNWLENKVAGMSENHLYTLYWMNDTSYCKREVLFTGIPIMRLSDAPLDRNSVACSVELYDTSAKQAYVSSNAKVSLRGATTVGAPKSSYKLTLTDEKLSFLGMRKDDDWVLISLYDDVDLIHNALSYQVWNRIASYNQVVGDEGTHLKYVELFAGDTYLGVYGLVERIDKKALSLKEGDYLYKCNGWDAPVPEMGFEQFPLTDVFEVKYPDENDPSSWQQILNWMCVFEINQSQTMEEAFSILDWENAVDYDLFLLLSYATDNRRKNTYFAARGQEDGSCRMQKIPWDMNVSWGNVFSKPLTNYEDWGIEDTQNHSTDIKKLIELYPDEMHSLLSERWKELRREGVISTEAITTLLDEDYYVLEHSGALVRNYMRWPDSVNEDWNKANIYQFIEKRIAFLDSYFDM